MIQRKHVKVIGKEFCQIEVEIREGGELSVCGVFGETSAGGGERFVCADNVTRRAFSFGQCVEEIERFFPEYAPLLPWHRNHMRPGCEHQTGPAWDVTREIEIVTYKLTTEAITEQGTIQRLALSALKREGTATLSDADRALLALPYDRINAPDADGPESGRYEVSKREIKRAGWVRPDEHPAGLLCKPCPVCGYKYGTEWKREELPNEIRTLAESVGR